MNTIFSQCSFLSFTHRLVSQSGYVVVDDTNRPQFDTSPWPWVVSKTYPTPSQDQCSAVKKEEVSYCVCGGGGGS